MTDLTPLFPDLDPQQPLLIAGPCSAETEVQTLETARALAAEGIAFFRAGLWKPRTKPGGFEGVGAEGLGWLRRVKEQTGMRTAVEVATRDHVAAALAGGVDLLWIGARTASDPFAVQQIADALRGRDVPVLVKNPLSPDLELWIGALERLYNAGVRRLGAIHRGFTPVGSARYRNDPMWGTPIELRRRLPQLPILGDPSHIGGRSEFVAPLAQQALALGFDGLMIEAHCTPDEAWSDRGQQLAPQELGALARTLAARRNGPATEALAAEGLAALRGEIDTLDDRLFLLLARRMEISREIGRYKRAHGVPVLQTQRYAELLARRCARASALGMTEEFVRAILQAVHEESVRQQIER